jgi:serine protease Do
MRQFLCVILLAAGGAVLAQEGFVRTAETVRPGLVSIVTDKVALRPDSAQAAPDFIETRSLGSGFVFDTLGHILTCNHVISGYEEVSVKLSDGTTYKGKEVKVVGRDPVTDLAVLQVTARRRFEPVQLGNSDELQVGQPVMAMGDPFGLEGTATAGIVSGLSRWGLSKSSGPNFQDFIQTDALVNPGNSGGPLVDMEGRAVGVSSFMRTGRSGFTGIGFASPINLARAVARQLIGRGAVIRGYLGIATQPLTEGLRQALGFGTGDGILVSTVVRDGPGMKAGIAPGDVIVSLDGQPVSDLRAFQNEIAARAPGSTVGLGMIRKGARLTVRAQLVEWPVPSSEPSHLPPPGNWLGITVRDVAATGKQRAFLEYGALVDAVESGSPALDAGIAPGDVIVEINFAPIQNAAAYEAVRSKMLAYKKPALFRVYRGKVAFYTAVGP